ncbi:thermonuclease family protein [Inhella gelatinilytica]|uniref:Thermonuclease family protein n=1 Tax=Inhella gelatinilytica TaxID=2795030 RepID=A0A931NEA8_9BURK|nr:thermonuclease family protein [Inhella gelatinilytica]MBH9553967.1 thermonuclease family protein [Inhella gelatinilytica]
MFLVGTLAMWASINSAHAYTIVGQVVGVHDGDTITLLDTSRSRHKIRLDGIDAPELGQPFGRSAKTTLATLVVHREVSADCGKSDRYGREICRVLIDGVDAGGEMLRAGMAWFYKRYARELPLNRRSHYAELEGIAQSERRGLWSDPHPVPPWQWRKKS